MTDYLGAPRDLVIAQGQRTWRAKLSSSGSVHPPEGPRTAYPFRYQGQYEDVETGIYYNRFRYYDPERGQYISQDPIGLGGSMTPYSYVQDPQSWVDVLGLSGCPTARQKRIAELSEHNDQTFIRDE